MMLSKQVNVSRARLVNGQPGPGTVNHRLGTVRLLTVKPCKPGIQGVGYDLSFCNNGEHSPTPL